MEKKHENSHMKITKDGKLVDFTSKKDSNSTSRNKNDKKDTQWKFHTSSKPSLPPLARDRSESLLNEVSISNSTSNVNNANFSPPSFSNNERKRKAKSTSSSNSDIKNIQKESNDKKYKSENSLYKMSIDFITSPP